MNPFKLIKYQLYLFQLENYNLWRFFRVALKFLGKSDYPQRKELVWTPKTVLIFAIAFGLQVLVLILAVSSFSIWALGIIGGLFLSYALSIIFFVFLIIAAFMVYPLETLVKRFIIRRAKGKILQFPNLKVIGITGSYGKTTMKEALKQVLSIKYQVLSTPDSVNTPVGIGRLILKELDERTQIFIAEMGAYQKGDIKALCEIARPDIAILTGINEAHLERFGSIENTIAAKFEIVENVAPDALVVLNEDNEFVKQNYEKYIKDRKVKMYSINNAPQPPLQLRGGEGELLLLGEYAKGIINGVVIIARELGLDDNQINSSISQIKPIPHRLQPIYNQASNILVIDDSYSGNPDGAREAIKVLSRFKNRRKIYITPGLVEMGERAREIHIEIGQRLAVVADIVILIKNSVTPFIEEGILNSPPARGGERGDGGLDKKSNPEILWFEDTPRAHAALPKILKSGDVIVFQNDWPENYI